MDSNHTLATKVLGSFRPRRACFCDYEIKFPLYLSPLNRSPKIGERFSERREGEGERDEVTKNMCEIRASQPRLPLREAALDVIPTCTLSLFHALAPALTAFITPKQ